MNDFLFRGSVKDIDPDVAKLSQLEAERQYRRLILIPSESTSPVSVREALSSAFHNIYAEGYPDEFSRWLSEEEILDYDAQLGHYRRYSDPRYYKGVEYANIVEALARKRCAETFATNGVSANDLYVNVQALSGGPANNAVYHALVNPGDTVMGMDLLHGGHLSHGSPVNRSGKYYNIVHYTINPETQKIDYDEIEALAKEHKPKMMIGGFSSYPWQADWKRMRQIADSVGAYLVTDIAHVAGLIAGKVYPSPIGHAHVVTSTTHKTLCGPRGAIILTTDKTLSRKIDRAVFPGEQGGPHVNVFAALAITFKLAQTEEFAKLQKQIVKNCLAFTQQFEKRGFNIPFGGTDTHLMNLDMNSVKGLNGTPLSGDQAARNLDLVGIVVNRNTIPGDRSPLNPSGIRMGTPWITQRGFKEKETVELADVISDLLLAIVPYRQKSNKRFNTRAKVDFDALENARILVRDIAISAGIDYEPTSHDYPHFFYLDDKPLSKEKNVGLDIKGLKVNQFLNFALTNNIEALENGGTQATKLYTHKEIIEGVITKVSNKHFNFTFPADKSGLAKAWLRNLSDGFVLFDKEDILRKLPGPISITEGEASKINSEGDQIDTNKPYYIGQSEIASGTLLDFSWQPQNSNELLKTPLYDSHKDLGAKMVEFGGWDMPVRYTSVVEEHRAVREHAGLFDVSHMGVYQTEGPDAVLFLDSVCGNDIAGLRVGNSLYTHFLDPDANVIDDLLVYRRDEERYLLVVNASNDDKDWAWLNQVKNGECTIDRNNPGAKAFGRNVVLRNLRKTKEGDDMLVDIALQGKESENILLSLKCSKDTKARIQKLKRTQLCEAKVGGFDLVVSRTGYTGESLGYELFVHPDKAVELWQALMSAGEKFGIKPCGLGARDSLRTEAGLPLYSHEMAGELGLGVAEAGFRTYVKTYKPWFIGRDAFVAREEKRKEKVIRFKFNEKSVRMAHLGDPVVNKRGQKIGTVTSCAINKEGYLTGQALVNLKYIKRKTPLLIFQSATDKPGKAPGELTMGEKINIPTPASVITRFPKL
ncbi:MAG: glycine cleavage system aminomethyltransferase GcvT [Chloroflexota bacterium]